MKWDEVEGGAEVGVGDAQQSRGAPVLPRLHMCLVALLTSIGRPSRARELGQERQAAQRHPTGKPFHRGGHAATTCADTAAGAFHLPISWTPRSSELSVTTAHLAELTRLPIQHGRQLSSTPAGPSDDNSQSLFIFIDGLDEGSGRGNKSIDRILGVVQDLETEPPLGRKIWISSRETFPLRQFMGGWPSITADDMSKVSVRSFLNAAVPDLGKQLGVGREIKGKPREQPPPLVSSASLSVPLPMPATEKEPDSA